MRNEWENKKAGRYDARYSRYIASWRNVGGDAYLGFGEHFEEWLISEGLTEEEASDCRLQATCGKLELEMSAKCFVKDAVDKIEENWEELVGE